MAAATSSTSSSLALPVWPRASIGPASLMTWWQRNRPRSPRCKPSKTTLNSKHRLSNHRHRSDQFAKRRQHTFVGRLFSEHHRVQFRFLRRHRHHPERDARGHLHFLRFPTGHRRRPKRLHRFRPMPISSTDDCLQCRSGQHRLCRSHHRRNLHRQRPDHHRRRHRQLCSPSSTRSTPRPAARSRPATIPPTDKITLSSSFAHHLGQFGADTSNFLQATQLFTTARAP
jgi:hypothetical protein